MQKKRKTANAASATKTCKVPDKEVAKLLKRIDELTAEQVKIIEEIGKIKGALNTLGAKARYSNWD